MDGIKVLDGKTGCICPAGVALAVILSGVRHISDTVFLEAAKVGNHHQVFLSLDPL